MPYPQIVEYHEAVQHPSQAFTDPELKQGAVAENNLGLPLVMSGGFALTYAVTTPRRKCAVPCFHREILVACRVGASQRTSSPPTVPRSTVPFLPTATTTFRIDRQDSPYLNKTKISHRLKMRALLDGEQL